MKPRVIIIAALALLILVAGFFYWRSVHKPKAPEHALVKIRVAAPAVKKKVAAKVAIVMDDFGYNMNNIDEFFKIKEPITLSILPHLTYSNEIARQARSKGYEVILHLPLEPHRKDVRQEADTINSRMSEEEVISKLEEALKSIDRLSGVSNHMGSKATEEKPLMTIILRDLKKHGLYFFDSLTSQRSVCQKVAAEIGLRCARRDVFLDLGRADDMDYIRKQVLAMRRLALKRGHAIAVCHDRRNTVRVLAEMMPQLSAEGIKFVYLSELVK